MAFTSIIGQSDAKARLGAVLHDIPGHAYVFAGPDGIGKNTLAREFAKALLCQQPGTDGACGVCASCRHFSHGVHPDFKDLQLENKEKNIKVERVRQSVCGDLNMRPQFGRRKVYLIDADALNEQGQNALLKSLEEPPDYGHFLLTAIGPERLLPTILSRVSLIALRRSTPAEIKEILAAAGCPASPETDFYARFAGGLPGVALDLANNGWFADLRRDTIGLYRELGRRSRASLLTAGYQFFDANRERAPLIVDLLGSLIRDQLVFLCSRQTALLTNQDQLPALTDGLAAPAGPPDARQRLARSYETLLAARRGLVLNASFEGLVCNLLLNLRKEFHYA